MLVKGRSVILGRLFLSHLTMFSRIIKTILINFQYFLFLSECHIFIVCSTIFLLYYNKKSCFEK